MEMDKKKRKARLEKIVATTELMLALMKGVVDVGVVLYLKPILKSWQLKKYIFVPNNLIKLTITIHIICMYVYKYCVYIIYICTTSIIYAIGRKVWVMVA